MVFSSIMASIIPINKPLLKSGLTSSGMDPNISTGIFMMEIPNKTGAAIR